eukprot:569090_1
MFSLFSRLDSRKLCSFILALVLLASTCDGFLNLHNKPHGIAHFASFTYTSTIDDSTIPDIVMSMTVQDSTKNNASFTSNYSGSFHQNPKKCQGVYIESPVHQSATPTQVEYNRDRIDFRHDTEESLDGFVIHAFGDSIMQDVIMYQSVQDWISITNATFDTMSVRNDATRASCGVVWIVIAITVFAFLLPTSFASKCPNDRFKMVASHHDSFTLNFIYKGMAERNTFNRYYIAFGRDDKWTLTLVDPKIGGEFVSFKCKENQLGSVEIIVEKTLHTEYTHKDPICCAASYLLDGEDRNQVVPEMKQNEAPVAGPNGPPGVAVNPLQFPVMPGSFALDTLKLQVYLRRGHTPITANDLPSQYQPAANVLNEHFHYYRYKSPTSEGRSTSKGLVRNSGAFLKWEILKMTSVEFNRLNDWKPRSWTAQQAKSRSSKVMISKATEASLGIGAAPVGIVTGVSGMAYNWIVDASTKKQPRIYAPPQPLPFMIPRSVIPQQCSSSTACDTGIVNDLAVFIIECARRPRGVVWWDDITKIKFAFSGDGIFNVQTMALCPPKSIHFFSALDLYEAGHKPQYSSLVPKWELGSFCASCPSTSLTVQVSEKQALTNKRRIAHTLSVSGGLKGGTEAVEANVAVGYSYQRAKEAARSLVSGQATTIKANCNGFSLWHWKMGIGTWGAGQVVVPTHLFYCTDRDDKPVCTPKAVLRALGGAQSTTCKGDDTDNDFGSHIGQTTPWMSMHKGRPKPIRLQGQKSEKNEPAFIVQNMNPGNGLSIRRKHAPPINREFELLRPKRAAQHHVLPVLNSEEVMEEPVDTGNPKQRQFKFNRQHLALSSTKSTGQRKAVPRARRNERLRKGIPRKERSGVNREVAIVRRTVHPARSSSFGDRLYLDENNAKGKSLEDQYVGTTRFIEKAHHFGSQSGPKVKRSQGNEFSLLRRKHRK